MSSNINIVEKNISKNDLYNVINSFFENKLYVNKLTKFIDIISNNIQGLLVTDVQNIVNRILDGVYNKNSKTVISQFDMLLSRITFDANFSNIAGSDTKTSWTYIKSHQSIIQILLDITEKNQKVINFCEIGAGKGVMSLKYIIAFHLLDIDYVGDFYEINNAYIKIFKKLFKKIKNVNVLKNDILLVDYSKYDFIYSCCPFTNPILEFLLERRLFLTLKPNAFLFIFGQKHYTMNYIDSKTYNTHIINQNIVKFLLPKNYKFDELLFFNLSKNKNKLKIMEPTYIFEYCRNENIIGTEDLYLMDANPEQVRAQAYDFVINGIEIGGGSIRIHDTELQKLMFKHLGFTDEEAREQFGFLIDAFRFGAPPHGGAAFGFDRLVMLFNQSDSIREVIAFPKNNSGRDVMIDAPSVINPLQLKELKIEIKD